MLISPQAFLPAVVFVLVLFLGVVLLMKTKKLVTTAVMIALAAVLSMVKIWKMPWGGSVTLLSMVPIVIVSLKYGTKWGLFSAFVYSLVQLFLDLGELMSWGLTPAILIGSFAFDYILAYTALGLAGIFGNKSIEKVTAGISLAVFIRFVCHFISGSVLFGEMAWEGWNKFAYSFCYNGAYMLPELILTVIGTIVIYKIPSINKLINE